MSASLPSAEPPADDVADLMELIRRARICRTDADHTLGHVQDTLRDQEGMTPASKMYLDVERIVGEHRLFLWGQVAALLESKARSMGLQP